MADQTRCAERGGTRLAAAVGRSARHFADARSQPGSAIRSPSCACRWALLALVGATCGSVANASIVSGHEDVTPWSTVFLSKFCFGFHPGPEFTAAGYVNVSLRISPHRDGGQILFLLFDDQAKSYPGDTAVWEKMTCEERVKHARLHRVLKTSTYRTTTSELLTPLSEKIRPRWWYTAISDCSGDGFSLDYVVHTWNPLSGWEREFSMDIHGLFGFCLFFLVFDLGIAIAQGVANTMNAETGKQRHPLLRILTTGIYSAFGSVLVFAVYYYRFAKSGLGSVSLYGLGKLLHTQSKLMLASIMMLVSRGRCISGPMSWQDIFWLSNRLLPFFALCFAFEIWGECAEVRRYTTGYVYATPPGFFLVAADLLLLGIYLKNLLRTRESELDPQKRSFYKYWGSCFACWFLCLPAVALLGVGFAPWERTRLCWFTSHAAHSVTFLALVVALWPSRKPSLFVLDELEMATVIGASAIRDAGMSDDGFRQLASEPC